MKETTEIGDLPLTSTHWGTYRARVSNGRVQDLIAFEHDPDPSPIGRGILDVQHGPTRIDRPMVRKSWLEHGPGAFTERRGVDPFVAINWEHAFELVGQELRRVREDFGNQAIFGGSYGWSSAGRFHHAQSQLHRFLNCAGGYTRSKFTYSFAAAEAMVPHILGSFRTHLDSCTSWGSIVDHTELFVCFGGIPLKNGQICQGGTGHHIQRENLLKAARNDIEFVNISPIASDLLDQVKGQWIAPRPNTDVAFLLGLAHTLYTEGLVDHDFLSRYTVGSDVFLAYVTGQSDGIAKSADWAAQICDIDPEEITSLARRMASHRTMISVSWSLTRQDHGEQPFWAAIAVAAMLGQIGLPGGGFGFGYSAVNQIGGNFQVLPYATLPLGKNKVADFIPVARISDMLLSPGAVFDFNGQTYHYPDIKLMYWAGGNPFHHHQDLGRLMQAWRKPETIIVHEWCWNALAKRADIVLPCTTPLERQDISLVPRDPYIVSMSKLTEPYGESKNDFDIFLGIARELGIDDAFSEGLSDQDWIERLYSESQDSVSRAGHHLPSYSELCDTGWHRVNSPEKETVMMEGFRRDPLQHPMTSPSGKIEIFSQTVAHFDYEDCPGHPVWRAPYEWLGGSDKGFPLHLVSNQPRAKLHSQIDHGGVSKASKIKGREAVHLNPLDAADRGLKDGDIVRVYSARGACLGGVVIDQGLRRHVVQMSTGAWYDPLDPSDPKSLCKHGNANVLTRDKGTSRLGQGPSAHSCLVEVEKYQGVPPEVTADQPPIIL